MAAKQYNNQALFSIVDACWENSICFTCIFRRIGRVVQSI